ncbi:MAG: hypothetical protein WAZ18_07410 [Alphaproteobacteria bacterium]
MSNFTKKLMAAGVAVLAGATAAVQDANHSPVAAEGLKDGGKTRICKDGYPQDIKIQKGKQVTMPCPEDMKFDEAPMVTETERSIGAVGGVIGKHKFMGGKAEIRRTIKREHGTVKGFVGAEVVVGTGNTETSQEFSGTEGYNFKNTNKLKYLAVGQVKAGVEKMINERNSVGMNAGIGVAFTGEDCKSETVTSAGASTGLTAVGKCNQARGIGTVTLEHTYKMSPEDSKQVRSSVTLGVMNDGKTLVHGGVAFGF